jgi:ribosomal protein S18 acetylase RimI-like enzyme
MRLARRHRHRSFKESRILPRRRIATIEVTVGYALGYTLPNGSGWWRGLRSTASPDLLHETGRRTFALTEIMVREAWRRRGYARRLHDALLADRPEERATLLVLPENVPARSGYLAWGWYKLGELKPFEDSPVYDAMMRSPPI